MRLLQLNVRGYVKTPPKIANYMVAKLFENRRPTATDRVLDAGCGQGEFIDAVVLWCSRNKNPIPKIIGVDSDKELISIAKTRFRSYPEVTIEQRDFLSTPDVTYPYIIANPPYVSILKISEEEKNLYKSLFDTAIGRFDLYLLFFEKSIKLLEESGRLVFITPEKYVYVETAAPLRRMLTEMQVREIEFLDENTFSGLTTYPMITIVENSTFQANTLVTFRDRTQRNVLLPEHGQNWLPILNGKTAILSSYKLQDVCVRISCGVATGADKIFVKETENLDDGLREFAYPTISGRELTNQNGVLSSAYSLLVPYDKNGNLLPLDELKDLKDYLSQPRIAERLKKRTCCKKKPWYSFHENPPMNDILCPKILCKDLTPQPEFWLDKEGRLIPRHSVYYIVPKDPARIGELLEYLKTDFAKDWLMKNCQRASNNFIRLQSHVLKKLPIPERLYSP